MMLNMLWGGHTSRNMNFRQPLTGSLLWDVRNLSSQDELAVFRTTDKVIPQLVGDVFVMLCFHPRQYNRCSSFMKGHVGPPYPQIESGGMRRADPQQSN